MLARHFCQWTAPLAETGTVLCVGLHLENVAEWARACTPFTTGQEQRAASRYAQTADAARHLAGRALARRMLQTATGQNETTDFARTPYGKPFCPQTTVDFSISHSGGMVWVALCRSAAVGIDVEEIRPLPDAAQLTGQLHPQERAALLAMPPAELETAFYRCWTRKEAVLKAMGTGLNAPLRNFCVRADQQNENWILTAPVAACSGMLPPISPAALWTSRDITAADGYRCSVAARAPRMEIRVHTG